MLAIIVVHFNTPALVDECLRSVLHDPSVPLRVVLVDNQSRPALRARVGRIVETLGEAVTLVDAGANLGFAGGCNLGIGVALRDSRVTHVLLLNSDAAVCGGAIARVHRALQGPSPVHLLAARVHRSATPGRVDSLGIVMYASALASNRLDTSEPLLGPTGGFALYSRELLDRLERCHGHVFDQRFFCYAEDTDLAWRAVLLGFDPAYLDDCVALHHGQASSGGGFNDFVLYHGIRNSIWVVVKGFPIMLLLRLLPRIVLLHCGIVLRHSLRGRLRVVAKLYFDAARGLPAMLRTRKRVLGSATRSAREMRRYVSGRFYDRGYWTTALRELFQRPGRSDSAHE